MGRDISSETWSKLEKNRQEGRLCGGFGHCTTKARVIIHSDTDSQSMSGPMKVCRSCAKKIPLGYIGQNFKVLSHEEF